MQILLAILSGILLIVSFPKFNLFFCAWIFLIPLLYAVFRASLKRSFVLGFVAGFISSLGIYYWVIVAILADGQSIILGIISLFALSFYLAVYWGLFSLCFTWGIQRNFIIRVPFFCAALWVGLELIRTYFLTGFPWLLLGYSQVKWHSLIQIAEWGGVYAVSFLVVLSNMVVFLVFVTNKQYKKIFSITLLLFFLFITGICIYGKYKIDGIENFLKEHKKHSFTFSLLQGNVDQYQKWDEKYEHDIRRTYEKLISVAVQSQPDIIIWPETALPGFFEDHELRQWLNEQVRISKTYHLVGAASVKGRKYYNSVFLLNPQAHVLGFYNKMHLVLFGEQVPFQKILGRFIKVLNELGGFESGKGETVVPYKEYFLGTSICFEAIFSYLSRKAVKQKAGVLVNLTNDAWFLKSAAGYQHLIMNVFRAIESRRFLLRCANTGISAIIEPTGNIKAQTNLFDTTILNGTCIFLSSTTFYSRWGDYFAYLCVGFALLYILLLLKVKKVKGSDLKIGIN